MPREVAISKFIILIGGLVISMAAVFMFLARCSELTPEPPGPPPPEDALLWEFKIPQTEANSFPGIAPTTRGGTLFLVSPLGQVYALDAKSGQLQWQTELDDKLYPPPVVTASKVYVNGVLDYYTLDVNTGELLETNEGRGPRHTDPPDPETGRTYRLDVGLPPGTRVHAVDAATGTSVWTYDVGSIIPAAPTQSGGTVFVQSYEGVHALDASTGELLWESEWEYSLDYPPHVVDGIWPVAGDGTVTALDARTGKPVWSFEEDHIRRVAGADGMVLAAGTFGFYGIEAATGKKRWRLNNDWQVFHVTVADGVIYSHTLGSDLHALDLQTGEPLRTQRIGYLGDGRYHVADGVVYIAHREGVRAYRAPAIGDTRPPAETRTPTPTPPPDGKGPPPQRSDMLWHFDTGQTSTVVLSPTIVQGRLNAATEGAVYALNAQTGELLWSIDLDTELQPPPVAAGSTVYIEYERGDYYYERGDYYALDAATGEHLLINFEETGRIRGVELRDGAVHVTAVLPDGEIVVGSYDPQTGQLLRESRQKRDYVHFKVTVLGNNIYIRDTGPGRDGGMIHAFDGTEGNLRWSFKAGETIYDAPAASDGRVYLRTYGRIHALDEATGDEIWSFEGRHLFAGDGDRMPGFASPLLVEDGVLAVPEVRGALHGLDAATGRALWSSRHGYAYAVAAAADGTLFVYGERFYALDAATGDEIWSISGSWNISGEVTVTDGVLYAYSGWGYLHALDARTGAPIWTTNNCCYSLQGGGYTLQDGVLYLADKGNIRAYRAPAITDTSPPVVTPTPTATPTPEPTATLTP